MAISKDERLLDLIAELLHTARPLTASQLQERIPGYPEDKDSFKRAFERDKAELRQLGVPIRVDRVPGSMPPEDGYRIDPDEYHLPDPGLEADELAALHLAANAVRLEGASADPGLRKLGAPVGGGSELATVPAAPHLVELFEAVGAARRLRFGYGGRDRSVDPLRLRHQRGRWYLQAHDLDADEPRSFRLDRIEGVVSVDEPGSATTGAGEVAPMRLDAWSLGDDEPVTALVRIRPAQARLAARVVDESVEATWEADGSVVLRFPVRHREGFRSFVLGFLDDAEVLDPPELREDLRAWLAAIAASA